MPGDTEHNDLTKMFIKIIKLCYYSGLPPMWKESALPKQLSIVQHTYRKGFNVIITVFIILEWLAFYTQDNLSEKQYNNRLMFAFSHPMLFFYVFDIEIYSSEIEKLLYEVIVSLKSIYNDLDVERETVRKSKVYSAAFSGIHFSAILFYGLEGILQAFTGGTFTTVITCWPDVNEISLPADVARVVTYVVWCLFMVRLSAVYTLVVPTVISVGLQYKNLRSYFYSLHAIFEEDIPQGVKEEKYEQALIMGIKMHSRTLWCTEQFQITCGAIFGFQVITNVAVLVLIMLQMVNADRTLVNLVPIIMTGIAILTSTGCLMCNAGDITFEASELTTAVYNSGWENCYIRTKRIRRLLGTLMAKGQKPVIIWALGNMELSYESYISIIKASYSVFSVLI